MVFQGIVLFAVISAIASIKTTATIVTDELNMRSGPGFHNPPVAVLQKGLNVNVLSYEGEWIKIRHKGRVGFIFNRKSFVKIKESRSAEQGKQVSKTQKSRTHTLNEKIEAGKETVRKYTEKEKNVILNLNDTDIEIDHARKKVTVIRTELQDLKKKINEAEKSFDDLEKRGITHERYAYKRLIAHYKFNRIGNFQVLASADSIYDFYLRKKLMETILESDNQTLDRLRDDQKTLEKLLDELSVSEAAKETTSLMLKQQISRLNREKLKKEKILEEIKGKKSLQLAAIESLKQSALSLDNTVRSFEQTQKNKIDDREGIKDTSFSELKGLLMMPVKGKIVSFFGHYKNKKLNVMNFQSGVNIKADRGEPIRAVGDGSTLYASWFKGYGNMIIIDHGDHYYTVYAHLEEVFKNKGDRVETGEVIATVGDTGSITGSGLHFEVRHHGKPMNPLKWIKKT